MNEQETEPKDEEEVLKGYKHSGRSAQRDKLYSTAVWVSGPGSKEPYKAATGKFPTSRLFKAARSIRKRLKKKARRNADRRQDPKASE